LACHPLEVIKVIANSGPCWQPSLSLFLHSYIQL
jgi:hypothetical protein